MKLIVKNLGAISHAEVDLSKDLILLTGENNTGKTYLAYTIYGLYNLKNKFDWSTIDNHPYPDQEGIWGCKTDLVKDSYDCLDAMEHDLRKQLGNLFAIPQDIFATTQINIVKSKKIKKIVFDNSFNGKYYLDNDNFILLTKLEKSADLDYGIRSDMDPLDLKKIAVATILLPNRTYLFTAERSGINVFSKELSLIKGRLLSSLLKNGKNQALTALLENRINRYSEPIQAELEASEQYDILRKKITPFHYLADELERNFLKGRIHASEWGDLRFTMDDSKKELEIQATSSTVKSLSPLVFYLRHIAQKNDFILIDEPELNLHPDNQRKIARFMGRLIQEGFKVLVSTHSDYIVRELNNLIMLHSGTQQKPEIAQDLLKTHGYASNELLDKERVGVYLFRLGKPVEAVSVEDAGFNVATIDEEASKLNQTSHDIYFNLFD